MAETLKPGGHRELTLLVAFQGIDFLDDGRPDTPCRPDHQIRVPRHRLIAFTDLDTAGGHLGDLTRQFDLDALLLESLMDRLAQFL